MQKITQFKVITCLLFFNSTFCFAEAEKVVQPFGELKWEDGLYSSVDKLYKMGASSVKLGFTNEIDKKIEKPKSKKDIEIAVINLFKKKYGSQSEVALTSILDEFIDLKGQQKKYYSRNIRFEAEGINVHGVLCTLTLTFTGDPSIIANYPENVFESPKWFVFVPLLTEVELSSSAPNIKENFRAIRSTMVDKYFDLPKFKEDFLETGELGIANIDGLNGAITDSRISITYTNKNTEKLDEVYRAKLSTLENKKVEGKKDMGDGL